MNYLFFLYLLNFFYIYSLFFHPNQLKIYMKNRKHLDLQFSSEVISGQKYQMECNEVNYGVIKMMQVTESPYMLFFYLTLFIVGN